MKMRFRIGRIFAVGLLAEFLAVLSLVLIVAAIGPSDPDAAQSYAERIGLWVGPIAGFLFTLIGGWWIAKGLAEFQLINGFVLGVVAATIDITILVLSGAEFMLVFAVSNIGRVIAGSLGGWLAGLRAENIP